MAESLDDDQPLTLDCRAKYGYPFGHVLNDLCVAVWFSYSLLFYKMAYSDKYGYVMVTIGQVSDAIATVGIGLILDSELIAKDRRFHFFCRLGRYTTCYVIGVIFILICFPTTMFEFKLLGDSQTKIFWIYFIMVIGAQSGWAFSQTANLSMINKISATSTDRIWLTSTRQAAGIYSYLVVYILFWYTLYRTNTEHLTDRDIYIFSNNMFFLVSFGLFHTIIYLGLVDENICTKNKIEQTNQLRKRKRINYLTNSLISKRRRTLDQYEQCDWLQDRIFYKITFIWVCSRIYMNLPLIYIPLYLQKTLFMPKTSIAIIPFLVFISAFFMSFVSNLIETRFGNKYHLGIGILLGLISSFWIIDGSCNYQGYLEWQIYIVSILIGCSNAVARISSLSFVGDMIGQNSRSRSFVYGMIGCIEKTLVGVFVAILESFGDEKHTSIFMEKSIINNNHTDNITEKILLCPGNYEPAMYYQYILSYGNIFALILLLIGVWSISEDDLKN